MTERPATRGDLLRWRAEQAHVIERALLSKRRMLKALGWMLLGAVGGAAVTQTGGLLDAAAFSATNLLVTVVAVLVMVAATVGLLDHRRCTRRLRRTFREVMEVDRTPWARALPAGRIEPGSRTVFDARDDDDLGVVAQAASARSEALAYGTGTMLVATLGVIPVFFGAVGVVVAFTVGTTAEACAGAASAAFLIVPTVLMWGTVTSVNWLHQREANRLLRERPAYLARAAALRGEPTSVKVSRTIPPERIAVAVVFLGIAVLRFTHAPMLGSIAIGGCLLLLLVAILVSRVLVRRPQVLASQVASGEQRGSVLQRPFARVLVTRDGADLVVSAADGGAEPHRLPVGEVLAVEPVRWHPVLPPAVAVLSTGEPLLLTGAGMLDQVRAIVGTSAATRPAAS